jgi:hypothetical protein
MEQERIKALLDKFYEGTTSEEEEAQLRQFLSDNPAYGALLPEAGYLAAFRSSIPEPSENFTSDLEAVTHMEITMSSPGRRLRYTIAAAAAVALLTGSYFLFNYLRPYEMKDTYSDPEIAMAEVKNILTVVSYNMKTGTEPLSSIRTMNIVPETINGLGRINRSVMTNLDKLNYLNKYNILTKTTEDN